MFRCLLALCLSLAASFASAAEPARVLIVGTYHLSNPGQDLANVQAVDITTPERQAELQAIADALARFEPTVVAVEWPAEIAETRYRQYLDGSLAPSSSEAVQLGFRLARQRRLERVHGLDVRGEFPFQAVQEWAMANGKGEELGAAMQQAQATAERLTALQASHSIGGVLRELNTAESLAQGHGMYMQLLRYGAGDAQPGVALNAAWEQRNLAICARLLQSLQPGDRAVAFYGYGHAYLLNRCIRDTPGVELVEANDFLPSD
jgi:hypothetical protein